MTDNKVVNNTVSKKEKSQTKSIIIFVGFLFLCMVAGFISSITISSVQDNVTVDADGIMAIMGAYVAPLAAIILNVAGFIYSYAMYTKSKTEFEKFDINRDDEELLDKIEYRLNYPISASSIIYILVMFCSSIGMATPFLEGVKLPYDEVILLAVSMISLAVAMIWSMFIQSKSVNLVKEINPEKRGNVFSSKFKKDWEDSCDEAEMLLTYKAAYKAFMVSNSTNILLWIAAFIGALSFNTGIFPIVIITAVMLINQGSYVVEAMKLEKH